MVETVNNIFNITHFQGEKSPKNAYSNLLDLLGKSIDNPVVTEYKER